MTSREMKSRISSTFKKVKDTVTFGQWVVVTILALLGILGFSTVSPAARLTKVEASVDTLRRENKDHKIFEDSLRSDVQFSIRLHCLGLTREQLAVVAQCDKFTKSARPTR